MEMDKEEVQKHPSFGMVRLARTSGRGRLLFGSSVKPDNWVTLTIMRGEKKHKYGHDWFHGQEELVEVELSPAQFAELITSFNMGSGVPCTLTYLPGQRIERFSEEDESVETRKVVDEIKRYGKDFSKPLDTFLGFIDELKKDKKLTGKMADEIKGHFYRMNQDMKSNIPFYVNQLDEAATKVVSQKKAELDAMILHTVTTLGMERLEEEKAARVELIASDNP